LSKIETWEYKNLYTHSLFILRVGVKLEEIKITYETLFELLRREKNREELQKLDDTFYFDVVNYLKDKFEIVTKPQRDLFSVTEKDKTVRELRNIQKILKDLYERREKKIINMALNKSRTDSDLIDTTNLLKEENNFFESLNEVLNMFRKGIILNILDGKLPLISKGIKEEKKLEEEKEEIKEEPEEKEEFKSAEELAIKKIKFLKHTSQFVGPELEEYGPYSINETVELPIKVADVLINKGNAEEVKE